MQSLFPRQATAEVVYDLTENNGPRILGIVGFLTAFTLATVLLRVYVRIWMTKTMGTDDYTMVASMVFCILVFVCMCQEVHLGIGRHLTDPIIVANFSGIFLWTWMRSLFIVLGISLVKISVGFFLLRVVDGTKYKRFIIGMIAFLVAFTIACLGTLIFQCLPVDAAWNFTKKPEYMLGGTAKCYNNDVFRSIGLFNGAINIATDFFFAVLPIPVIWGLNVNTRTKLTLIFILGLGFFACAAAIVKEVLLSTFFTTPDFSFKNTYAIWNYVELTVGIFAACLPALRPLFAFILEKASSTFAGSRQTGLNTRHKYYMQSNDINLSSVPTAKKGDRYGVTVTSNGRPMGKLEKSIKEQDGSEENILVMDDLEMGNDGPGRKNNGIVKTTEVRVS